MRTRVFKMVWTDPRTDTEYFIISADRPQTDIFAAAPTTFLVRNLRTGEQASFHHESLDIPRESLAELVDEAESLIRGRSRRRRGSYVLSGGRRLVGSVMSQAKRLGSRIHL